MEDKKVKVEVGYYYELGRASQSYGSAKKLLSRFWELCEYTYISIEMEECLPWKIKQEGRIERRKSMERGEIPEESLMELVNLIPKENPYGIYLKRI